MKVPILNAVLVTLYRQPNDPIGGNISTTAEFQQFLTELNQFLAALPVPLPTILIGGDFNLPNASWPSCSPRSGASADEKNMISALNEVISINFLHQLVNQPTHRGGNTLDLLLSNNHTSFTEAEVYPATVSSHKLIVCHTSLSFPAWERDPSNTSIQLNSFDKYNFFSENVDWEKMNVDLQVVDWESLLQDMDVSQMADTFIETCLIIASKYAPNKRPHGSNKRKIPRDRRILMRKRTKVKKKFKSCVTPTEQNLIEDKLISIEAQLMASHTRKINFREEKAVNAINVNSKYFFSYAKKNCASVLKIGPLADSNGQLISDPGAMAEILSEQYGKTFSTPTLMQLNTASEPEHQIEFFDLTTDELVAAITEIPTNSAPGPDRFPAIILKSCKHALARPLQLLWQKSLNTGVVPLKFKCSIITPIYKSGPRQYPKNYRPVALTSHLVKIFEKL